MSQSPGPRYHSATTTRQDKWVVETVFGGRRGGFFVDIGATDGVGASNTLTLERELGWNGICVEPNAAQFSRLVRNRACICENVCAYSHAGHVTFIEPGAFPGYGGIAAHLVGHKKKFWSVDARETTKDAEPLAALLRRHGAPRQIDYLSLDVEGSEFEILKTFPFREFAFVAITVEGASCDELLAANGYRRVNSPWCRVTWEHFFVHPGTAEGAAAVASQAP